MPKTHRTLMQETIAAVWIQQVKLNNKVNFLITKEEHLYLFHLTITFLMRHLLTSQT
jgi:hypothetical protein